MAWQRRQRSGGINIAKNEKSRNSSINISNGGGGVINVAARSALANPAAWRIMA